MIISKRRAVKHWTYCLMLRYSVYFVKMFGRGYQNLSIFHCTNYILDTKATNHKKSCANNSMMIV